MMKLPIISNRFCQGFTACGRLLTNDKTLIHLIASHRNETEVARFACGKIPVALRAIWGGESNTHVHIDLVKDRYVPNWIENSTRLEISKDLEGLFGIRIQTNFFAKYVITKEHLSLDSVLWATFFDATSGGLSVELTGAELTISGAPVQTMRWARHKKNKDKYMIELSGSYDGVFESEYVVTLYRYCRDTFKAFVLGD